MVASKTKINNANDLIVLYKHFASLYKANPTKQLECFTKLIGNEHETPRVFTTLISLLGKILDKNIELMDPVIKVLTAAMQTKRMNVENCNYMLDLLNAKKKELRGFAAANLSVFIKQATAYKNAMQTIEDIIENPGQNDGSRPCTNTKYGVTRPTPETHNHAHIGAVVRKPQSAYSTKYGVSAKCLATSKRGSEGM